MCKGVPCLSAKTCPEFLWLFCRGYWPKNGKSWSKFCSWIPSSCKCSGKWKGNSSTAIQGSTCCWDWRGITVLHFGNILLSHQGSEPKENYQFSTCQWFYHVVISFVGFCLLRVTCMLSMGCGRWIVRNYSFQIKLPACWIICGIITSKLGCILFPTRLLISVYILFFFSISFRIRQCRSNIVEMCR